MADVVTPEVRSRMMSGIRGKDTKPELMIRQALHAAGFRYRLHRKDLPGRPDLVFPRRRAVLCIHGCFWHGHDCHLFRLPGTRTEFWREKIARNIERDHLAANQLGELGWQVGTVWECALRGRTRLPFPDVLDRIIRWLDEPRQGLELRGAA